MSDVVAFPDVEAALIGWLADALPVYGINVPLSTQVPNPRPDRFIRLTCSYSVTTPSGEITSRYVNSPCMDVRVAHAG